MKNRFKVLRFLFGFIVMTMIIQIVHAPLNWFPFEQYQTLHTSSVSAVGHLSKSRHSKHPAPVTLFAEELLEIGNEEDPNDRDDDEIKGISNPFSESDFDHPHKTSLASQHYISNKPGLFLLYCSLKVAFTFF